MFSYFNGYLLLVFITVFSGRLVSTGVMMSQAMDDREPIVRTAIIVGIQALAALFSLILVKIKYFNFINLWSAIGLTAAVSYTLSFFEVLSYPWIFIFLLQQSLIFLTSTLLVSGVTYFAQSRVVENNQKVQSIISLTFVISLGLSPYFISVLKLKNAFVIQAGVLLFCALLGKVLINKIFKEGKDTTTVVINSINKYSLVKYYPILFMVFLVWISGGIFSIIEVPLLKYRFDFERSHLSAVFIIYACLNLVGISFFPKGLLHKHTYRSFLFSSVCILLCSFLYLITYKIEYAVFVILLFGLFNGFFTVSSSSIFMTLPTENLRNKGLLLVNLVSKAGMLFTTIIFILTDISISDIDIILALSIIVLFISILLIIIIFKNKIVKSMTTFMALLLILVNNSPCKTMISFPVTNIPQEINPRKLLFLSDAIISNQIFDTLYEFTSSNSLLPRLAKKHVISKKGLVFKIYINRDIKFSNGKKLTASIVENSLKDTIHMLGGSIRWAVGKIKGYDRFIDNPVKNRDSISIFAKNDDILEIHLSEQFPLLLQILAAPYFSIVLNNNRKMFGTGNYVIHKKEKDHLLLKKIHEKFTGNTIPDQITFRLAKDKKKLTKLIKNKQIDFFDIDPRSKQIPLHYTVKSYNVLRSVLLYVNTKKTKLKIREVRCNLISKISQSFNRSSYKFSSAFKSFPFSWDIFSRNNNRLQLKPKLPDVDIIWHRSETAYLNNTENEVVRKDLARNGLNVTFSRKSTTELVQKLTNGDFELALIGWIPDYFDPDALLFPTLGEKQQYNFSGYHNKEVSSLLKIERSMTQDKSRNIILKKIFNIISVDCPVHYFGGQKSQYAISKEWEVTSISSLGFYHFRFRNLDYKRSL